MYVTILDMDFPLDTKELNFIGYDLTEIPKNIFKLLQMQTLYLDYNKIKEIPEEIKYLTQLKKLVYIKGKAVGAINSPLKIVFLIDNIIRRKIINNNFYGYTKEHIMVYYKDLSL